MKQPNEWAANSQSDESGFGLPIERLGALGQPDSKLALWDVRSI